MFSFENEQNLELHDQSILKMVSNQIKSNDKIGTKYQKLSSIVLIFFSLSVSVSVSVFTGKKNSNIKFWENNLPPCNLGGYCRTLSHFYSKKQKSDILCAMGGETNQIEIINLKNFMKFKNDVDDDDDQKIQQQSRSKSHFRWILIQNFKFPKTIYGCRKVISSCNGFNFATKTNLNLKTI